MKLLKVFGGVVIAVFGIITLALIVAVLVYPSMYVYRVLAWRDSDAFPILSAFRGNLLIIAAESDHVIPRDVIDGIYAAADNARTRHLHVVPGSRHLSLFPKDQDFRSAMDVIIEMCRKA